MNFVCAPPPQTKWNKFKFQRANYIHLAPGQLRKRRAEEGEGVKSDRLRYVWMTVARARLVIEGSSSS